MSVVTLCYLDLRHWLHGPCRYVTGSYLSLDATAAAWAKSFTVVEARLACDEDLVGLSLQDIGHLEDGGLVRIQ